MTRMSVTSRVKWDSIRGLTFVILVTHWNGFDDFVLDDLPRCDGFSSSSSEEHIAMTCEVYRGGVGQE